MRVSARNEELCERGKTRRRKGRREGRKAEQS